LVEFKDFSMTFHNHSLHDIPGLENPSPKFHDFPVCVESLCPTSSRVCWTQRQTVPGGWLVYYISVYNILSYFQHIRQLSFLGLYRIVTFVIQPNMNYFQFSQIQIEYKQMNSHQKLLFNVRYLNVCLVWNIWQWLLITHQLTSKARFPLPELTARVNGWPVSITRQHKPCWRVMETGHMSTRAVNSGSVNRA